MWSQTDSFSSQPGVNAIIRPISKGWPESDSQILYCPSGLSYSSDAKTASWIASRVAGSETCVAKPSTDPAPMGLHFGASD